MNEHLFQRLADERERLGFTQEQMAKAGGVAKRTYCNYETGDREPPSSLISKLKAVGADIGYLLFGVRELDSLGVSPSEERLINLYRQMSDESKNALEAVAISLAQPAFAATMLKVAGRVSPDSSAADSPKVVIQGDSGASMGDNSGKVKVDMGRKKK